MDPGAPPRSAKKNLESGPERDFVIDGTERRIQRPKNDEKQKRFYSGKKKAHVVKNVLVAGLNSRLVKYLSKTYEGKKHDKSIADSEPFELPDDAAAWCDLGFQGLEFENAEIVLPEKKPRGAELSEHSKTMNTFIASLRVVVEHVLSGVKRFHIVKDILRSTTAGFDDLVMEIACASHNFRQTYRHPSRSPG